MVLPWLLLIERRYELDLGPLDRAVAIGLSVLSILVILSNTLMIQWSLIHLPSFRGHRPAVETLSDWWNGARLFLWDAMVVAWCFALRKPLPASNGDKRVFGLMRTV